jgi:hypothetical protein
MESYPARVVYDDWYERVGGLYDDYLGVLMKATGERFSMRERKMLAESVIDNIKGEWADPCRIKVTAAAKKNQMVISIHLIRKKEAENNAPLANLKSLVDSVKLASMGPLPTTKSLPPVNDLGILEGVCKQFCRWCAVGARAFGNRSSMIRG